MSEEQDVNALFATESFDDSVERRKKEQEEQEARKKGGVKRKYIQFKESKEYLFRVLPFLKDSGKQGYAEPISYLWVDLINPAKPKAKAISRKIVNATFAGYETDPIATYRGMVLRSIWDAADKLKGEGDETGAKKLQDKSKKVTSSSYQNPIGLKQSYAQMMLAIPEGEGEEVHVVELSQSQFKTLDDERNKIWPKLEAKAKQKLDCPVCSPHDAYLTSVEKKKSGNETKYSITLDIMGDVFPLTVEQIDALVKYDRVNKIANVYSRYQFESSKVFMVAYDKEHGFGIYDSEDFQKYLTEFESSIPVEDTSKFSFDKKSDSNEGSGDSETEVDASVFDDLIEKWDNEFTDVDRDDKAKVREFRAELRKFVADSKLTVVVSARTTVEDMITLIDAALVEGDVTPESNDTTANDKAAEEKAAKEAEEAVKVAAEKAEKEAAAVKEAEAKTNEASPRAPRTQRRQRAPRK